MTKPNLSAAIPGNLKERYWLNSHSAAKGDTVSWLIYVPFVAFPIALLPKAAQLLLFALLLMLLIVRLKNRLFQEVRLDSVAGLLFGFISIYLLSILIDSQGAETDRIFAAFNTWATWMLAVSFYVIFRHCSINRDRISTIAFANIATIIFLALLHYSGIQIALPWDNRTLSGIDWINGMRSTRLHAFLEYSTLVAAMYFIFFPLSLRSVARWRCTWLAYGYCIVAILPVVACSSRMGILLAIAVTIAGVFYIDDACGNGRLTRNAKLFLSLLVAVCFIGLFHNEITMAVESLLDSRQGSTDTRSALYEYSLHRVLGESPLFGCGIKEIVPQFGDAVPVGSHSTYIGILYRTGIVGFVLFFSALLMLIRRIALADSSNRVNGYRLLFVLVCCAFFITEDIDGADWLVVCTFAVAGLLSNRCRDSINDEAILVRRGYSQ